MTKYVIVISGVVTIVFGGPQDPNNNPGYQEISDTDPLWVAYLQNDLAAKAKTDRDTLINAIWWRIQRYESQVAAGITPTETSTTYQALLTYVQALRDVPSQAGFPNTINWPVAP